MTKKIILTLLGTTALFATTLAYAEDKTPAAVPAPLVEVKIGAGSESGEYYKTIVPAISKALVQHGYSAVAVVSAGSQENIDKVTAGELQAGLSQLDVAALNTTKEKDPEENCSR
ncbi:MAG: TAXI family TRAP transporter solute-binding subunit [Thiotrichaceae bacterium]